MSRELRVQQRISPSLSFVARKERSATFGRFGYLIYLTSPNVAWFHTFPFSKQMAPHPSTTSSLTAAGWKGYSGWPATLTLDHFRQNSCPQNS